MWVEKERPTARFPDGLRREGQTLNMQRHLTRSILLGSAALLLGALVALGACDGQALVVGGDASTLGDAGGSSAPTRWAGYLENYQLPSGSDHVTITFTSDTTGRVFFGDPPALAPPTDAAAAYPPGAIASRLDRGAPLEHFEYTMLAGNRAGDRFTFEFVPEEIWRGWCALQTPYPTVNFTPEGGDGGVIGYGCMPNVAFGEDNGACHWDDRDGGTHPIDCVRMVLCLPPPGVCDCVASSCGQNLENPRHGRMRFDLARTPQGLDGTLAAEGRGPIPVHLKPLP